MKFKAKPRKVGNSWVVTIPMDFIENEMMNPDQEYQFYIQEVKEDDQSQ